METAMTGKASWSSIISNNIYSKAWCSRMVVPRNLSTQLRRQFSWPRSSLLLGFPSTQRSQHFSFSSCTAFCNTDNISSLVLEAANSGDAVMAAAGRR